MSKVRVLTTNTFDDWRVKTNEIGAGLGDMATLTPNAVIDYTNNITGQNQSDFTGTPATFNVKININVYEVTIVGGGTQYAVSDVIIILGSEVGGVDGINDVTVTVASVTNAFAIATVTVTGTPTKDIVAEVNQLRTDAGTSPTQTALTTTANTYSGGINELDGLQGNVDIKGAKTPGLPKVTFASITDGIKKIDDFQGNVTLPTTAQTVSGALAEHEADIGTVSALTTTSKIVVGAIDELKVTADDAQSEIGGNMASDYDGPENTIIGALDSLYLSSSTSTLDQTYLKRNGSLAMFTVAESGTAFRLSDAGITALTHDSNNVATHHPMSFNVGSASSNTRMYIKTNGYIGVGKTTGINYKLDVSGTVNADALRYGTDDTDVRYLRTARTTEQEVSTPNKFTGVSKFEKELYVGAEKVYDSAASGGYTFTEWTQDVIGGTFTSNTETGGISAVYDDPTGKISLAIANNSHDHVSTNVSDWAEAVQDTVGAMISGNTESGISVDYVDADGTLDFNVNDPVLTISGDATGSATMTNLGSTNIAIDLTDEAVQDIVGAMVSGNTETGITVDYQDTDGTLDFVLTADPAISMSGDVSAPAVTISNLATGTYNLVSTVADNSHNHTASNVSDWTESVQDTVGAMVSSNSESGLVVSYDDTNGKLDFNVNDPTFRLIGDVTSDTVTQQNLGNVELTTTLDFSAIDFSEQVEDIVGAMITGNTETGIDVTYADNGTGDGKLNFALSNDPTITLSGDVTGSAQMTNLSNVTIATTYAANSVDLNADTSGDYVALGATSGSGISGSTTSGAGHNATFTVYSNATTSNTASTIVYRDGSGGFSAGNINCNILHGSEVRSDGEVTAYYSDARLKDFEGVIPEALDKVNSISGYYFKENSLAKSLGYKNPNRQVGVSAQEIQEVLPECVAEAAIDPEYLTVRYEKLVPLLIEAIKELSSEVDELKKRCSPSSYGIK
jgi:hypothetical protein